MQHLLVHRRVPVRLFCAAVLGGRLIRQGAYETPKDRGVSIQTEPLHITSQKADPEGKGLVASGNRLGGRERHVFSMLKLVGMQR